MKILMIDHLAVCARSVHVFSNFHNREGVFTGGVYGFARELNSMAKEISPDVILVCTDSPPYDRSKAFPQYKADRIREYDPRWPLTLDLIDNYLKYMKIPLIGVPGAEADDLFGCFLRSNKWTKDDFIIASKDTDLFSLLEFEVTLYRGKGKFYTRADFQEEYGFGPDEWKLRNALVGSHNNVPGVPGIGPAKAKKIILDKTALAKVYSEYKEVIDLGIEMGLFPFSKDYFDGIEDIVLDPEMHDLNRGEKKALNDWLFSLGINPNPATVTWWVYRNQNDSLGLSPKR